MASNSGSQCGSNGGSERGRKRSFSFRAKSEPLVSQLAALQPQPQALHSLVSQSASLQPSVFQQAALQSSVSQPLALQLSISQPAALQHFVSQPTASQSSHNQQPAAPQSSQSTTSQSSVSLVTVRRKARSKAKVAKLEKHVSAHGKVHLTFTGSGLRPTSSVHDQFLVGECGRLTRTNLPFQCYSFGHIQREDYDALIHRLQKKIVWDLNSEVAQRCIYKIAQRAYNAWKRPLVQIIKRFPNANDALRQRPADISYANWKWLVDYVHSPLFKSLSERNALNRAMLPYDHPGGSRPFIFHVGTEIGHSAENAENFDDQPGEESEDPSETHDQVDLHSIRAVKLFFDTHYSEDKGWTNDVAKHTYDQMLALLENSQSSPDGPITEFQAAQMVLGTRRNYVRGLGRSVIPPLTSEESFTSTSKDEEIKALRIELDNMKQAQEEREKQIEEREKLIEEREKKIKEMTRILAVFEQLQRDRPHVDDD